MERKYRPAIPVIDDEIMRMYLGLAYRKAERHSHDPMTRVGALIIEREADRHSDRILGWGANHFGPHIVVTPELLADRKRKGESITHAEDAALAEAKSYGHCTIGKTAVVNWMACDSCAGKLVKAGIERFYCHLELVERTPERWWPYLDEGIRVLRDGGVELYAVRGSIGGIEHKFNGELWLP